MLIETPQLRVLFFLLSAVLSFLSILPEKELV